MAGRVRWVKPVEEKVQEVKVFKDLWPLPCMSCEPLEGFLGEE